MDREEARELLLGYSRFINEETDLWEALDLAIEALKAHEKPLRSDLIQRKDVLDLAKDGKIISNTNYEKVVAHINNIPSADYIPLGTFHQVRSERDTALKTLEEHGIGLGQIAEENSTISEKHQLSEETSTNEGETSTVSEKESVEGDAESATTTDCDDCIWNTCNYNKIDWEASEDCISRADTIKAICAECLCKDYCQVDCTEVAVVKGVPPCNKKQVTSKLKNPCDSLLKPDSDECKEQKSKLECISRQQAIEDTKKYADTITDVLIILENLPPVTPTEQQEHGRLIDADKLLQELFIVDEEEWTTPEIRAILENAPSVTPTERTGEWIYNDDYTCTNCGFRLIVGDGAYNYCPNCGAKMGGEESIPDWQKEIEEEYEWLHWDIR